MDCSQASLSFTISQSLLKLMTIESVMPSNHLVLVIPFSSCLQSFPASGSFLMSRLVKALELQLQHQSFQWIFRTDFLRKDWLDLLAVQGTHKSLLQYHNSKTSVLQCSAFFIVQLSIQNPCMTTGKTIALTRWTFVGKVMSLLFNMLSRLVIIFFQGASVFSFHGYNHNLQLFWSPKA